MSETHYLEKLNLETDFVCLDFADTVEWHASDNPEESLFTYGDLVSWAQGVGLLTEGEAQKLQQSAESRPAEAEAVYRRAHELREAIYRIFVAIAHEGAPAATDLALLNGALPQAAAHFFLTHDGDGYRWAWKASAEDELDQMLWPIVRSAADLLTSDRLDRVRQCADDRGCGYLFVDMTRNRSRRWCSMESCGNRAKAQRHYQRQQEQSE